MSPLATSPLKGLVALLESLEMQPEPWFQDAGLTRTSNDGFWGPQDKDKYPFLPQAAHTKRQPDAPQGVWLTLIRITARPLDGFPMVLALQMWVGARTASNAS
ncbi:hypothetical protein PCASD_25488 [Puccinia coronata f. sp. avenae]|uniref:Uncharacterized protein n=1 Tax=Puccinia coronata f. sp. avenae TaxID=200324 RepID=A0A2N5TWE7_9BASI|nr:hypothetical protein PCASD_26340 [Puccinia coronata f. sp. avenae]PLW29820.1 hypothetical protein PCASD_25488 [Puccinia coronata f. sp. avenae]